MAFLTLSIHLQNKYMVGGKPSGMIFYVFFLQLVFSLSSKALAARAFQGVAGKQEAARRAPAAKAA